MSNDQDTWLKYYRMKQTKAREDFATKLANGLDDAGLFRNCLNCANFHYETEICAMYKQRPPARIIVTGCPDHTDLIPF